jgi:hypothetical protein
MPIQTTRFHALRPACFVLITGLFSWMLAAAQTNPNPPDKNAAGKPTSSSAPASDYSGMYSFVRDGEFVQLTLEDQGHVTGFISRYGDSENDRGVFLDQFFKPGKLEGNQLAFTTETVHGVAFEFHGTIDRGEGKNRADEAYYVLKGTLVKNTTDDAKKTSSQSSEVALKSFPQDLSPPADEKKKDDKKDGKK